MTKLAIYHSHIGNLLLGATSTHLVLCDWLDKNGNPRQEILHRLQRYIAPVSKRTTVQSTSSALLKDAKIQLDEYFQGTRLVFSLPIKTFGTPFQQQVWQQLQTISYGTIMTYKEQAEAINQPKAIRAVANANRLNALSVIIPCHRVIGCNHALIGYAGGLNAKLWLLNHEQKHNP